MPDFFLWIAIAIIVLLIITVVVLLSRLKYVERELDEIRFSKSSQSVRYGKMTEQFIPFTKEFPFEPENFRFLGNPIDGIVFEDDKIVFAEFKASGSKLSERQGHIKSLVIGKKVEWFEQRIR